MTLDADKIEAVLPQTQCQLCEFPGCRPYAEAIANQTAPINKCLPGGVETLYSLGEITGQDPASMVTEMEKKSKAPAVAIIRESQCIGCTKCITACPVDAIIGAPKAMHTIITDACTGCELCLPPCPTDCIDILPIAAPNAEQKTINAAKAKQRYEKHLARKRSEHTNKKALNTNQNKSDSNTISAKSPDEKASKLSLIQAALNREKARRNQ